MANFTPIVEWLLRIEDATLSGKVVDLGDGQGLTRFGIGQKSNPEVPAGFYTVSPLIALGMAQQVYKATYWDRFKGDNLIDDGVASCLLSFGVNDGTSREIKMLQQVLGLQEDGVMGPITLMHTNNESPRPLAAWLRNKQALFYKSIPNNSRFIDGWLRRAALVYPALP